MLRGCSVFQSQQNVSYQICSRVRGLCDLSSSRCCCSTLFQACDHCSRHFCRAVCPGPLLSCWIQCGEFSSRDLYSNISIVLTCKYRLSIIVPSSKAPSSRGLFMAPDSFLTLTLDGTDTLTLDETLGTSRSRSLVVVAEGVSSLEVFATFSGRSELPRSLGRLRFSASLSSWLELFALL